jgi:hypothetical protein
VRPGCCELRAFPSCAPPLPLRGSGLRSDAEAKGPGPCVGENMGRSRRARDRDILDRNQCFFAATSVTLGRWQRKRVAWWRLIAQLA